MDNQVQPIFILGSERSGTSIITQALRNGVGIEGYHEGHFLSLLHLIMNKIDIFYTSKSQVLDNKFLLIANTEREEFEKLIISNFKTITESLHKSDTWLDKTPGAHMIKCVPYLVKIWPNAKFVFAKRRGIENVISRLNKFPKVSFERHCKDWALCMQSWLDVKELVNENSIEIEQREIALNPQVIAERLGAFLKLEPDSTSNISKIFTSKRPQSTGSKEQELAMNLNETGWTKAEIESFKTHCSEINRRYGYSESASYYL